MGYGRGGLFRRLRIPLAVLAGGVLLSVVWPDMFWALIFAFVLGFLVYQVLFADVLGYRQGHGGGPDAESPAVPGDAWEPDADGAGDAGGDAEDVPFGDVGGWHCMSLYLPTAEGGQIPEGSDAAAWSVAYHARRGAYGVEPRYDAARAYLDGEEAYLLQANDSGVPIYSCEYLGASGGCLVPRRLRPESCRWFRDA